jgi:photosystem II stability/assembly factor-like uncharacterized protein
MTQFKRILFLSSLLFLTLPASRPGFAATHGWLAVGPDGGDARSFAPDPSDTNHIYLGTISSWIYETEDNGVTWHRLAKLSKTDDFALDNIVVDEADPKTLYVGAWVLGQANGGLFISHDSGRTWTSVSAMAGQSIRALAQSASNPKLLVAGTLQGVFRSEDGGVEWKQISPLGSMELHEVESIAIDPRNPLTMYAGTWHLPWKTTDGGVTWHNIKQGLIDDSDVFSIIIDPVETNIVYTSACSGIYRSANGGELYHKVQGIPSTARRTRVLMQDPVNRHVVYAGTTEGLYKTVDDGVNWKRMTGPDVIVNDVHVDPKNPQHVLLATDRSGVLESNDAGVSFQASNRGFSQRQVASLLVDAKDPQKIYAGVLNDKGYGGVFVSTDQGATWSQQSSGLEGRDVYSLGQPSDGSLLAGTNEGIFRWDGAAWQPANKLVKQVSKTSYVVRRGRRTKVTTTSLVPAGKIEGRVIAIDVDGDVWSAATSDGVYTSSNQGASWEGGPVLGKTGFLMVASHGSTVLAAQRRSMAVSSDGGAHWQTLAMPEKLTWLHAVAIAPDGSLWLGGREGVFFSHDAGQSWQAMSTLPILDISGVSYDPELKRIIVTSSESTWILGVDPTDRTWKWWDPGWSLREVRSSGGRLLGASLYSGVIMQPRVMTATAAVGTQQ